MTQTVEDGPTGISDGIIIAMLREQQTMSAVDKFAQSHEHSETPAGEKYYRDLIPVHAPGEGEQYAFEVDLDECSGCKACVVACHNQNGLEEDETWRRVGLLVGGKELPIVQHVTSACHHCVEPACASGCPVAAYEKDPTTGIVLHLDDQCIGCQYCMLKCPYDVPVYSRAKGIVRKCDMCHQRLSASEAPACVQACPNQAIRIRIVNQQQVREESEAHPFLPAAPAPSYTMPTTVYKSERILPRDTLPADYFSVHRAHGHLPLVVMLVLTQMSVGAFIIEHAMYSYFSLFDEKAAAIARPLHLCAALLLGMLGLGASLFHLGRPLYAYRALLGLRTSWLSREILAFNAFAGAATIYVAVACLEWLGYDVPAAWRHALSSSASLAGLAAVICSVMIYVDTRRPLWTFPSTITRFVLTCAVLGAPTALLISLGTTTIITGSPTVPALGDFALHLCRFLLIASVAKLAFEASIFAHLRSPQYTPRRRSALLLSGELSMVTLRRYFFGVAGGIALPLLLISETAFTSSSYHPLFVLAAAVLMFGLLIGGELHERYLFFAASVAPRMPGAPAA